MSIRSVADAWVAGRTETSGNVRTDGRTMWSWDLVIGRTKDGCKVAIDHRVGVSGSTTRHCGVATLVADTIEDPGEAVRPEPIAIVSMTIAVPSGGPLDALLSTGTSWRWSGHDWHPVKRGDAPTGEAVWEVRLAARVTH